MKKALHHLAAALGALAAALGVVAIIDPGVVGPSKTPGREPVSIERARCRPMDDARNAERAAGENLCRLSDLLSSEAIAYPALREVLGSLEMRPSQRHADEVDLGFGLGRFSCRAGSSGFVIQVQGLVLDDPAGRWVADARVELACARGRLPASDLLQLAGGAVWTAPAETTGATSAFFAWTDAPRMVELRQRLADELGIRDPVEVPAELAEQFELLTDPYQDAWVSLTLDGEEPRWIGYMAPFVSADRWDLLRSVLRSPSPGGRICAALTLRKYDHMLPDDVEVIRALRALDTPIPLATKCMLALVPAAQLIDPLP